jgi:hypothetical protein
MLQEQKRSGRLCYLGSKVGSIDSESRLMVRHVAIKQLCIAIRETSVCCDLDLKLQLSVIKAVLQAYRVTVRSLMLCREIIAVCSQIHTKHVEMKINRKCI